MDGLDGSGVAVLNPIGGQFIPLSSILAIVVLPGQQPYWEVAHPPTGVGGTGAGGTGDGLGL